MSLEAGVTDMATPALRTAAIELHGLRKWVEPDDPVVRKRNMPERERRDHPRPRWLAARFFQVESRPLLLQKSRRNIILRKEYRLRASIRGFDPCGVVLNQS